MLWWGTKFQSITSLAVPPPWPRKHRHSKETRCCHWKDSLGTERRRARLLRRCKSNCFSQFLFAHSFLFYCWNSGWLYLKQETQQTLIPLLKKNVHSAIRRARGSESRAKDLISACLDPWVSRINTDRWAVVMELKSQLIRSNPTMNLVRDSTKYQKRSLRIRRSTYLPIRAKYRTA